MLTQNNQIIARRKKALPYWIYLTMSASYMLYASFSTVKFTIQARGNYMILLFIVACMVLELYTQNVNKNRVIIFLMAICVISFFYQLFVSVRNTPYPFFSYLILLSSTFFPVALYMGIVRRDNLREMRITVAVIAGMFAYLYINTAIMAQMNRDIVHAMTNLNYESSALTGKIMNILSYDHSYATTPLILLCLYCAKNFRTRRGRILAAVATAFLLVMIFIAEFTSVLLILAICLCVYIWRTSGKGVPMRVFIIFLIPVAWLLLPYLFDFVATKVDSQNMTDRLTEVSNMIRYGDFGGYNMGVRLSLYWNGIKAFFRSPLFGNQDIGFNPHSTFIQFAADTGLMGLLPYLYMIRMSKKYVSTAASKNGKAVVDTCFVSLILTGMINPIIDTPVLMITVWLFVPLVVRIVEKEKEKNCYEFVAN